MLVGGKREEGTEGNLHQGPGCQVKILTCADRQVYYSDRC